jgi:hypothetical protein
MSAKPFYPQYCSKCMRPIVVSWPPTEHKCEPPQDLSWALPPDTIQVSRAEYEALWRDAERLDHLERESSVNFDYENCILTFEVPDDFSGCNSVREAIDAAINMPANGEGDELRRMAEGEKE